MGFFSKRIDRKLASYQRELIETHYREVDNMYRQIRGWRHDYRNHIQTMKAYAAAEDWDAIRHYLDLLDEDLTKVDTVIKTGNAMTDAILNSKISLAKAKGIPVVADAHIPVKLKSSEIDPGVYGYEEYPAVYFLYQFYRRQKDGQKRWFIRQHKRRRARIWAGSDRRYRRAVGRLSEPQQ